MGDGGWVMVMGSGGNSIPIVREESALHRLVHTSPATHTHCFLPGVSGERSPPAPACLCICWGGKCKGHGGGSPPHHYTPTCTAFSPLPPPHHLPPYTHMLRNACPLLPHIHTHLRSQGVETGGYPHILAVGDGQVVSHIILYISHPPCLTPVMPVLIIIPRWGGIVWSSDVAPVSLPLTFSHSPHSLLGWRGSGAGLS